MARRKTKKEQDETLVDIVDVRDQAVNFYERNQNAIIGAAVAVLVLIGGYIAYQMFYKAPRQKAAQNAMYMAEYQFGRDSFALALENPGQGSEGFLDIMENYSGTTQANTAKYYAGVSYLNLGRYEDAVAMLKSFNAPTDLTKATKFGALGDAYSELGNMSEAESNYKKAANASDVASVAGYYMQKLAMFYKYQGKNAEAQEIYKEITEKYPDSEWGIEAQKFVMD
ncbi:tetratricopeptide repeat protein [Portibacter marinus]|uniref:tetratricopeptide repeat protein n=1 Tax=Portibacter marinus TaxID=2898660 RepID=UPI001F2FED22|nr:tetratricopeptide repeat protein [Portibacter marinus]